MLQKTNENAARTIFALLSFYVGKKFVKEKKNGCGEKNNKISIKIKVKNFSSLPSTEKRMYKSKNVIKKLLFVPNHKSFSRMAWESIKKKKGENFQHQKLFYWYARNDETTTNSSEKGEGSKLFM